MYRLTHFQEAQLQNKQDEVTKFLSARWLGTAEACCRIFKFDLYDGGPPVVALHVHLHKQQTVNFPEGCTNDEMQAHLKKSSETTLTQFYKFNAAAKLKNKETILYKKMPEHNTWGVKSKTWGPRVALDKLAIGRMHTVHPTDTERFHLRLLLSHVPGPTCEADLKTVNGVTHDTFQEAAVALGLATDPHEFACILEEASTILMPRKLRHMFAMMIAKCEVPKNAVPVLFEQFSAELASDHTHAGVPQQEATNETLLDIQEILANLSGATMEKIGRAHV